MKHVEGIYSQMMKPDTVAFWESVFEVKLNLYSGKFGSHLDIVDSER